MTASPARLISSAGVAWELRAREPRRAEELAGEIAAEAAQRAMPGMAAIAEIILAALRLSDRGAGGILDEVVALEPLVAGEPLWRARLFHLLGLCHAALGKQTAAITRQSAALAIFEENGERADTADTLNALAVAQFSLGEYLDALEYNRRALALYEQIGDRPGMARSSTRLGAVLLYLGDMPEALVQLERSIAISRESGDRRELARALNNMGVLHLEMGDYPTALEHHGQALAIREAIGDPVQIAGSLLNIGTVHNALNDYPTALEYFRRALAIKEEQGDPAGIGNALNNIGNASMSLGDSAAALEQFARSREIWERIGNRSGEAGALHNLGYVTFELGDYRAALDYYQRALKIFEAIGERKGIAAALSNIGNIHFTLGRYEEALEHGMRTLAIRQQMNDRAGVAESLVNIGNARLELGQPEEAIRDLEEALAIVTDIGAQGIITEAHIGLVTAFERTGRHRQALAHMREHVRVMQEIQSEEARTALHRIEVRHRVLEVEKEAEIERLRNVELAEALRQLKSAQAQLVQSEKMAGIGQLTAGIAHEINNPINYVSASLPSLERDLSELATLVSPNPGREEDAAGVIEEMKRLLGSSLEGARRVSAIVAGLRSFSRLEEGERKPVDLHEGLDATIALLGSKLGDRIAIDRFYGALPAVQCYPGEINQVFMNILSNAIDAIESEGSISITTTADDAMVNIAITDTGSGIAPENIERIFDPFFTTRDVGRGTGLGLAICHGIITKHDGAITVTSTPGAGSTFRISLTP